jgi:hypothetical protein
VHPLDGVGRKIKRADDNIKPLYEQVIAWSKRDDYRFVTESKNKGAKHIVRVQTDEIIPSEWALMVGDFVHNLRSALDHLVHQLVTYNRGTVTTRTAFPIFADATKYRQGITGQINGVPGMCVAKFLSLQPHFRSRNAPTLDPLWWIHELDRIDKHRLLHVVAAVPREGSFNIPPHLVGSTIRLWRRPVEHGTVIAEIYPLTPQAEVDVYRKLTLNVTIQETKNTPILVLPTAIEAMRGAAREAVRRLGPFVEPSQGVTWDLSLEGIVPT